MNKTIRTFILSLLVPVSTCLQAQEFKRDIEQGMFIPKGQWIAGSSISYSEYTGNNYNFLVIEGIDMDGYSVKVSPVICYAIKDNLAVGGRFMYSRSLSKLDNVNININEDNSFELKNMYQLQHTYSGMAILRNYISLGRSTRFALFNETQFEVGGSQSKLLNGKGESMSGTYETAREISIAVSPGLVAFINNFTAVEVNVGVLGFSFNKVKQVTDQVNTGERHHHRGSFKINIFSIGLGIAFYL